MQQDNPPFDPDKPTVIYFSGGNCIIGSANDEPWDSHVAARAWYDVANIISFPEGYVPDPVRHEPWLTYYNTGDMIIVYLSSVAPQYDQPIQVIGWSTGGGPAADAGIRLNRTYADPRYAVNHVTLLEADCRYFSYFLGYGTDGEAYHRIADTLIDSAVDGEPCWIEAYWGKNYLGTPPAIPQLGGAPESLIVGHLLMVHLEGVEHFGVKDIKDWYSWSLTSPTANEFNHGVVAGAFWSVVGPGKNLQPAYTDLQTYFKWEGTIDPDAEEILRGHMSPVNETRYPGRFPEPITLLTWRNDSEPKGIILSCKPSENAVHYELILGTDPYSIRDYRVFSDTPDPPIHYLSNLPLEETWWTVKGCDAYGSTIYADPIRLETQNQPMPQVLNATTGKAYGSIELALYLAEPGDEIAIGPGHYAEDIIFDDKNLIVRSTDPNDPNIIAATIITGDGEGPVVAFTEDGTSKCLLTGLTISGGTIGISCRDASPTIKNCIVEGLGNTAIEFWYNCNPSIINCTIGGDVVERVNDPTLVAYWTLDETEGQTAYELARGNDGSVHSDPIWRPDGGIINGALELDGIDDCVSMPFILNPADSSFSAFAWIKGGTQGQVILSQQNGTNWLMVDANGGLRTNLTEPSTAVRGKTTLGSPLISATAITGENWHRIGFTWDGTHRILYVDDIEVAHDALSELEGSEGGLHIGAGSHLEAGTFWSGMIDDVRIYDRVILP